MPVKTKSTLTSDATTQRYLPFSQIRENVIILKDDSWRMVLECSTINFLLKSEEEQNAIILSFQRFLNALNFPIQIIVRSKKLDIDWYIANLEELSKKQENPLLKEQTEEYINFLNRLVEVAQIMKKEFYIVVPFDYEDGKSVRDNTIIWLFKNFWLAINNSNNLMKIKMQIRNHQKIKKWLQNRVNIIKTSLESIWIRARELEKWELVKFLTDYYNPNLESHTSLKDDVEKYNVIQN